MNTWATYCYIHTHTLTYIHKYSDFLVWVIYVGLASARPNNNNNNSCAHITIEETTQTEPRCFIGVALHTHAHFVSASTCTEMMIWVLQCMHLLTISTIDHVVVCMSRKHMLTKWAGLMSKDVIHDTHEPSKWFEAHLTEVFTDFDWFIMLISCSDA